MPKSKCKSSRKRKRKPSIPASMRQIKQAGYEIRAFEINDNLKSGYKPGIEEEIAEATMLVKQRRLDKAKRAFESIMAREPGAREAYTNLAAIYELQRDRDMAISLLWEAAEKFPRYVFPRANLAKIHLHQEQIEQAQELMATLDRVKRFTSTEFELYALTWSDILAAKGEYMAAISWLRMLSDTLPDAGGIFWRRVRYTFARIFKRGKK